MPFHSSSIGPRRLCVGLIALMLVFRLGAASAQEAYPSRTVKIIVPFPPGGASTDGLARAFAQELARELKGTVVVENRPGAGTSVGALAVKSQPVDGHTLLFQADGLFNAKLTNPSLAYETADFEILTPLAQTSYALVVPAARGWKRLEDLKGLARELDVGTLGIGVSSYAILAERLAKGLGIAHRMVPFKGGVEGVTAVGAGEIDAYFSTIGLTQSLLANPRFTVLAYTGSPGHKSPIAGVRSFADAGLADMVFNSYYGLAIRAGTPDAQRLPLLRAVRKVAASDELKSARQRLHLEDYEGDTEAYRRDVARMFKVYETAVARERSAQATREPK